MESQRACPLVKRPTGPIDDPRVYAAMSAFMLQTYRETVLKTLKVYTKWQPRMIDFDESLMMDAVYCWSAMDLFHYHRNNTAGERSPENDRCLATACLTLVVSYFANENLANMFTKVLHYTQEGTPFVIEKCQSLMAFQVSVLSAIGLDLATTMSAASILDNQQFCLHLHDDIDSVQLLRRMRHYYSDWSTWRQRDYISSVDALASATKGSGVEVEHPLQWKQQDRPVLPLNVDSEGCPLEEMDWVDPFGVDSKTAVQDDYVLYCCSLLLQTYRDTLVYDLIDSGWDPYVTGFGTNLALDGLAVWSAMDVFLYILSHYQFEDENSLKCVLFVCMRLVLDQYLPTVPIGHEKFLSLAKGCSEDMINDAEQSYGELIEFPHSLALVNYAIPCVPLSVYSDDVSAEAYEELYARHGEEIAMLFRLACSDINFVGDFARSPKSRVQDVMMYYNGDTKRQTRLDNRLLRVGPIIKFMLARGIPTYKGAEKEYELEQQPTTSAIPVFRGFIQ